MIAPSTKGQWRPPKAAAATAPEAPAVPLPDWWGPNWWEPPVPKRYPVAPQKTQQTGVLGGRPARTKGIPLQPRLLQSPIAKVDVPGIWEPSQTPQQLQPPTSPAPDEDGEAGESAAAIQAKSEPEDSEELEEEEHTDDDQAAADDELGDEDAQEACADEPGDDAHHDGTDLPEAGVGPETPRPTQPQPSTPAAPAAPLPQLRQSTEAHELFANAGCGIGSQIAITVRNAGQLTITDLLASFPFSFHIQTTIRHARTPPRSICPRAQQLRELRPQFFQKLNRHYKATRGKALASCLACFIVGCLMCGLLACSMSHAEIWGFM